MKKRSKMVNQEAKMHQHKDEYGQICGMAHPIDAVHKNLDTRKRHLDTIAGRTIVRQVVKKKKEE